MRLFYDVELKLSLAGRKTACRRSNKLKYHQRIRTLYHYGAFELSIIAAALAYAYILLG